MKVSFCFLLMLLTATCIIAQTPAPSPSPTDQRGLGIQSATPTTTAQANQQSREAKPELVLQTGYNNLFGATRLVFSPDGRLLATATFRSNTIKLWETATGRKLRDLSSSGQSAPGIAPVVAFSRDSRLLAAGAADNSVKVWDVMSGRELHTLAGSQGSMMAAIGVYFIAFASNNQLVTISDAARVWDLTTGRELRTLESRTTPVVSGFNGTDGGMTLSPDGNQLAIIGDDNDSELKFIDLATGRETRRVKLPDQQIESLQLSFNPEGHLLAAGIVERRFKFWDLTAKKDQELARTAKDYSQVKFSRDGRLLALSENYNVKIWDVTTMRELRALKVPNSGAFTQGEAFVTFSEDGKRIATGGFDTGTIVWETETGKQLANLSGRTNMAYNVAFSADGTQLSSGGYTRWDLRTGRGLRIAPRSSEKSFGTPSPDGKLLAVMRPNSGVLSLVEIASGRELHSLTPSGDSVVVQRLRFSADSTMLAISYAPNYNQQQQTVTVSPTSFSRGSAVKLWDVKTGREVRSLASGDIPMDADFSADGRMVAVIGSMGQISLWDAQSGSKLRDLAASPLGAFTNPGNVKPGQMPSMPNVADMAEMMTTVLGGMSAGTMGRKITSLAFSADGRTLATGGFESKANIDLAAMMGGMMGQPQKGQKRGSKPPDTADLMKDLKVEAIGQVQLWDVATGREIAALKGHGRGVAKVAFSRDGKLLASGGTDNTIKIWDVETRRELLTLTGHTANLESMDFNPDGRLLASASEDGSTFLWDTKTGEHLLTLISLDDGGEWMVVTPQGLFDGTPVSWNQILWRYNQETFNVAPIEWFFNEFYYPGLLADVFAGKRPRVAQDVSKKDRRQPVVKLSLIGPSDSTVSSRTIKVKIDIADEGSGAQDVRLFRNGSLVKVWHGDVVKGQAAVALEEEITVTAGPNRLVAYAFNRDNVKSKDAPLVFTGAESLKRKGTAYIIAVGVNEYANTQYNLKYAVADARSFGDEMRRRQTQIASFERVEVIELLDANATKANILSVIKRLAGAPEPPTLKAGPLDGLKRAEPEDTVIIYYAGHGTAQAQRFYLIPHDLGYTGDRTRLTEAGLKTMLSHSISDVELEAAVEGLDAGHLLLIIDACNSGQALEAEEKRRGPMNSKGLAQLAYEKGMYILTAAQSFQAALEAAQLGHGYLTYALVEEGLKTPIADTEPKDGVLIAREWLNFATERVPRMQEEKMAQGRGVGLEIAFTEGEANIADPQKRTVQRPRVFYRRELEANPLVIARP
jgi:WD40 repeat protein/uncharacterized caspase-like protein